MEMIVNLIAGAIGGNVAGGLLRNLNMGALMNSIVGAAGGLGLSKLLPLAGVALPSALGAEGLSLENLDVQGLLAQLGAGVAGGGVLSALLGAVLGKRG